MQNYLIIILFVLLIYFPALKCLIIVDDIRWFRKIKEGHFKTFKGWRAVVERLYSGGTFDPFEDCHACVATGKLITKDGEKPCGSCKGGGRVERQRKYFGKIITGIQIDHAFSIFLMCIICTLMYLDFHSLWAVLLFASSSVTTHIGVWLNGRRYAINIILALLVTACIHLGGWWLIPALGLYAITPYFHMTAFFLPVLYPWSIPLMIILLVIFWDAIYSRVMSRLNSIFECDRKYLKPRRIIVVIKTYGFYFFKMILPLQTRTCYGFLYMWGETPEGDKDAYALNRAFYTGIMSIGISLGSLLFLPSSMRPYGVFLILSTCQWCNIINATQVCADRYICMPLVFMSVILAHFLPWQVCMVMVAVNTVCTSQSYRMYENVQGMFDYHFYHWPNVTLVNKEYIAFCIKIGDYIKAYTIIKECLRYNPTDFALLHAAAVCARVANQRPQARAYVDMAEKHLYYGQEDIQKKWIQNFRASL
jgi:hypothetical protein